MGLSGISPEGLRLSGRLRGARAPGVREPPCPGGGALPKGTPGSPNTFPFQIPRGPRGLLKRGGFGLHSGSLFGALLGGRVRAKGSREQLSRPLRDDHRCHFVLPWALRLAVGGQDYSCFDFGCGFGPCLIPPLAQLACARGHRLSHYFGSYEEGPLAVLPPKNAPVVWDGGTEGAVRRTLRRAGCAGDIAGSLRSARLRNFRHGLA